MNYKYRDFTIVIGTC